MVPVQGNGEGGNWLFGEYNQETGKYAQCKKADMATAVGIYTWIQVETHKKCQNRGRNKELDRKATFFK